MSVHSRGDERPHIPGIARPSSGAERAAAVRAIAWRRDRGLLTTRQACTVLEALGILPSVSGGYTDPNGRRQRKARRDSQGQEQTATDQRGSA